MLKNDPNYTINPDHNILELYNILEQVLFIKNETEIDIK